MKKLVALTLIAVMTFIGFTTLTAHASGTVDFVFTVRDADSLTNAPIEGATVTILGTAFQGTTNADGIVVFENVPEGTYNAQAEAAGFQTTVFEVKSSAPQCVLSLLR